MRKSYSRTSRTVTVSRFLLLSHCALPFLLSTGCGRWTPSLLKLKWKHIVDHFRETLLCKLSKNTNCHCPSVRMRKGKENEGLWWRRDFFSPPRQGKRIFICWLTILVFYSLEKYLSHLNLHRSTLCLEAWFLSTSEKTVVVSICTCNKTSPTQDLQLQESPFSNNEIGGEGEGRR